MCGHVGIAGALEHKDEATLKRLLLLDFFRGEDGTGFAQINRTASAGDVVKVGADPIELFHHEKFKKMLSAYQSSVFMGHNRAATKGAKNRMNSHPFEFDHIIGCHNGTLTPASFKELNEALEAPNDVDSASVFESIANYGVDETLAMMQGAWALVWFDLEEKTLNFLRNEQRPFWLGYSKLGDKIFWASEHEMITAAVSMSTSPSDMYNNEQGHQYWQLPVNTLYTFKIADIIANKTGMPPTPDTRPLKGKEVPPVVGRVTPFPAPTYNNKDSTKAGNPHGQHIITTTTYLGKEQTSIDICNIHRPANKQLADFIHSDEFFVIKGTGCDWCHGDVNYDDLGSVWYDRDNLILCKECNNTQGTTRVYVKDLKDYQAKQQDKHKVYA